MAGLSDGLGSGLVEDPTRRADAAEPCRRVAEPVTFSIGDRGLDNSFMRGLPNGAADSVVSAEVAGREPALASH